MKVLAFVGKLLIAVGVGVLFYVAWTLWGTGLYTAREQNRLAQEFAELPPIQPESGGDGGGREDGGGPPRDYAPEPGDPVFRLLIPKIDVDDIVVEGVDTEALKKGPGHFPRCRGGFTLCLDFKEYWPGEAGRVIISGHRTTYGAPFWDLDRVRNGDIITAQTKWGNFDYKVSDIDIVSAGDNAIVVPGDGTAELVLTTCNPRFSATERLIVYATMEPA
jgi:sortase A